MIDDPRGKVSHRPRRRSRRIPIRGYNADTGRYFRCWNCGFICNKDRDLLGDNDSQPGTVYTVYTPPADATIAGSGDPLAVISVMDSISSMGVSLATDTDGSSITATTSPILYDISGTGCPFCHSLNWRGDY